MGRSTMTAGAPNPDEIRIALELVLASQPFVNSPKLAVFLRFVFEAALAGRSSRLKDFTIAVEALGRGTDFDPATDAIVRVHASRVRRALKRYYTRDGASDAVVISLPRHHYVPAFHRGVAADIGGSTPDGAANDFIPLSGSVEVTQRYLRL